MQRTASLAEDQPMLASTRRTISLPTALRTAVSTARSARRSRPILALRVLYPCATRLWAWAAMASGSPMDSE